MGWILVELFRTSDLTPGNIYIFYSLPECPDLSHFLGRPVDIQFGPGPLASGTREEILQGWDLVGEKISKGCEHVLLGEPFEAEDQREKAGPGLRWLPPNDVRSC